MLSPLDQAVRKVIADHHLLSAHRCSCGWEGDHAMVHLLDALHAATDELRVSIQIGCEHDVDEG